MGEPPLGMGRNEMGRNGRTDGRTRQAGTRRIRRADGRDEMGRKDGRYRTRRDVKDRRENGMDRRDATRRRVSLRKFK